MGFLSVAALLALGPSTSAAAWCRMTTSAGEPVFPSFCATGGLPLEWRRRCIEYAVDMRGSSDLGNLELVESIIAASFSEWESATCDGEPLDFQIAASETLADCRESQYNRSGGNANVVAFVPRLDVEDDSILALTSVWFSTSTGEILDADILINESEGPFVVCPDGGCVGGRTVHDLQNVLTHEVGHFFGLAHTHVLTATMYAAASPRETLKRTLDPDDIAGICAAYPPGSLPASCDFTPRGGRNLSCASEDGGRGCSGQLYTTEPRDRSASTGALGFLGLYVLGATVRGRRRPRR